MDILFWKDVGIAIAIGSKVIDILNQMGITEKPGWWGVWHRYEWLPWLESAMLIVGLSMFIFLFIFERFSK